MQVTPEYMLGKTIELANQLVGGGARRFELPVINQMIGTMLGDFGVVALMLGADSTFYRGRRLKKGSAHSTTDKLVARKAKDIEDFGRCHSPGQSVLYASSNLETVFSELSAESEDEFQLITLKVKEGKSVPCALVGEVDHVRRHGRSSVGNQDIVKDVHQLLDSRSTPEKNRLCFLDAFLADRFRQPALAPHDYKITSCFSEHLFSLSGGGILYPSVGHLGGINIAVPSNVFFSNFEITESRVCKIFQVIGFGIFGNVEIKKSKKIHNNKIQWKDYFPVQFPDFDSFICHSWLTPGNKVLFFQTLKKNGDANEHIQRFNKIDNGAINLGPDVNLELVKTLIAQNSNQNWDAVIVTTVDQKDETELKKMHDEFLENIGQKNSPYQMFDKSGNVMPILPIK